MRSLRLPAFLLSLLVVFGAHAMAVTQPAQRPLTSVRAIRALSTEATAKSQPVRLTGTVTALSGWKNSFFFSDGREGISVDRIDDEGSATPAKDASLQPGQRIELRGVTGAGSFAPIVRAAHIVVLGKSARVPAPERTATDLASGREDSQWITLRGTVRLEKIRSFWGRDILGMNLDVGSGLSVFVRVHDYDAHAIPQLIGAFVSVTGVCGTRFNDRRQFAGVRIFTPDLHFLKVLRAAPADPFDRPVRPLDALLQFNPSGSPGDLLRTGGTVTWRKPGEAFYLQQANKGLFVQSRDDHTPAVGQHVDVIGYPVVAHGYTRLQASFVRTTGSAAGVTPVAPQAVAAAGIIGTRDGFSVTPAESLLVRMEGRLVDTIPGPHELTLLLEDGHTPFRVHVPSESAGVLIPGSTLRVTGVCAIEYDDYTDEPSGFFLQTRTLSDIVVAHNAPWWNAAHTGRVALALAFVVLALLAAILYSRQASLRSLATTDALTGLSNRRTLIRVLERTQRQHVRHDDALQLIFVDIDRFKEINDEHGHRRGDLALQQVAGALREAFAGSLCIARLGGDEFAAVMPQMPHAECEARLQSALDRSAAAAADGLRISLSTGILEFGPAEAAVSVEDLLEAADGLMYRQKRRTHRAPPRPPLRNRLSRFASRGQRV